MTDYGAAWQLLHSTKQLGLCLSLPWMVTGLTFVYSQLPMCGRFSHACTGAKVVDSVVLRYPRAVTHFTPGSFEDRPNQATSVPNVFMVIVDKFHSSLHRAVVCIESQPMNTSIDLGPRTHFTPVLFCYTAGDTRQAGDWIKGLQHGANGLSQERAYVTGLTAANLVIQRLGRGRPVQVLDVDPDEPHIALTKQVGACECCKPGSTCVLPVRLGSRRLSAAVWLWPARCYVIHLHCRLQVCLIWRWDAVSECG